MQATAITTARVRDTLDEVSRLHAVRRDADAALFELAAVFADQHPGDALVPGAGTVPGGERSVRVGGTGTPRIAEFAYAELGARMQMSPVSARRLVADALDVRHRLPQIWSRVVAREARVSNARLVATRTRHLSTEAAAYVDRAMADHVDGSLPWGRFETRLAGKVVAADPAVAAGREAARVAEQFAKRTRSSEEGTAGFYVRSTVGVIARLDATIGFLADALRAFGDRDVEDLRRVKAVALLANPVRAVELLAAFAALRADPVGEAGGGSGLDELDQPEGVLDQPEGVLDQPEDLLDQPEDLLDLPEGGLLGPSELLEPDDALGRMDAFARRVGFTPRRLPDWLTARAPDESSAAPRGRNPGFAFDWSRLLPSLTMHLHFSAADLGRGAGGVVRWEGEGPVTHAFVHDHLRPLHRYVIKPVIDLAHQAPVDAYELPDRLREAVHLVAPTDVFPFAGAASRGLDADHTIPYDAALGAGPPRAWSTRLGNLGPLGRFHHRIKTHGRWVLRQPFTGIYLWRDPHGVVYLEDHTGTREVSRTGTVPEVSATDPEVEVYPSRTVIRADFGRGA
jgi:hypothetical protein